MACRERESKANHDTVPTGRTVLDIVYIDGNKSWWARKHTAGLSQNYKFDKEVGNSQEVPTSSKRHRKQYSYLITNSTNCLHRVFCKFIAPWTQKHHWHRMFAIQSHPIWNNNPQQQNVVEHNYEKQQQFGVVLRICAQADQRRPWSSEVSQGLCSNPLQGIEDANWTVQSLFRSISLIWSCSLLWVLESVKVGLQVLDVLHQTIWCGLRHYKGGTDDNCMVLPLLHPRIATNITQFGQHSCSAPSTSWRSGEFSGKEENLQLCSTLLQRPCFGSVILQCRKRSGKRPSCCWRWLQSRRWQWRWRQPQRQWWWYSRWQQ